MASALSSQQFLNLLDNVFERAETDGVNQHPSAGKNENDISDDESSLSAETIRNIIRQELKNVQSNISYSEPNSDDKAEPQNTSQDSNKLFQLKNSDLYFIVGDLIPKIFWYLTLTKASYDLILKIIQEIIHFITTYK